MDLAIWNHTGQSYSAGMTSGATSLAGPQKMRLWVRSLQLIRRPQYPSVLRRHPRPRCMEAHHCLQKVMSRNSTMTSSYAEVRAKDQYTLASGPGTDPPGSLSTDKETSPVITVLLLEEAVVSCRLSARSYSYGWFRKLCPPQDTAVP